MYHLFLSSDFALFVVAELDVLSFLFRFSDHEVAVGHLAQEMGFTHVSLSSEIMPMVRIVPRGYTGEDPLSIWCDKFFKIKLWRKWGQCTYVIVHTNLPPSPVILWIELGGKPKWLPLKCGYHDVMRTTPIYAWRKPIELVKNWFWNEKSFPGYNVVVHKKSIYLDKCLEAKCREKTLEKSGLEPTAPNCVADRKHFAFSTQPNPYLQK